MIVAFMSLHILLFDEVLLYYVVHVEVIHSLNLNYNQEGFKFIQSRVRVNPLTQLT
jgi:hypothetical protein